MRSVRRFTYRVYNLVISSEFELKELKPCESGASADLVIRSADLNLLKNGLPDQEYKFSNDRQVAVFPEVGAFVINGLNEVLVEPKPGVSDELLALPLLGPILAIWLHLRRQFTLHGSAIVHERRAYGFIGDKGAGKSTLAAMLLKNPGVEFLTDDLLVITEKQEVLRGFAQMKLSNEALLHSDTELGQIRPLPVPDFPKSQFLLDGHLPDAAVQLGGVFALRRGPETMIEDVTMSDAIRILLRFSYIARFVDREMNAAERQHMFDSTTRLAATGKVKCLYVPEKIEKLSQVIDVLNSN